MPTALQLAQGDPALEAAVRPSRTMQNRSKQKTAAGGFVPVPGVDWAVNAALLSRLIPKINAEFGLDTAQLEQLNPHKREQVQKAVNIVGTVLVGKLLTRELIMAASRQIGMRITVQQAAKYVPLAGQAVSALIGYSALRYIGEQHIKDCVKVAQTVPGLLPAPTPAVRPPKQRSTAG